MNTTTPLSEELRAAGHDRQDQEIWPVGRAVLFMVMISLAMWASILAIFSSLFK